MTTEAQRITILARMVQDAEESAEAAEIELVATASASDPLEVVVRPTASQGRLPWAT